MDQLRHDIRFAFRSILRNPTISLVAVISLALGIGANAAIFSAVDVFMLRPLPYPESEQLVKLWETFPERGWTGVNTSMPKIVDWREQSRTMEIAGYDNVGLNMSGGDQPERLSGLAVSHNFFDVLRVRLAFFLVGVNPLDVPVFGLVTLLVLLTGVAASYLPARRATRVDPMLALRPD